MAYTLIGKNFTPPDIHGKVTGKAKYAEDFRAEGMLYARLLTSPIPHARVTALDVSAALAIEGVVAVLTADDVPAMPGLQNPILTNEPAYVGDPILAVAAIDEQTAEDAIQASQYTNPEQAVLNVVVPVFSRISNHTDFDMLRTHPQINLQFVPQHSPLPPAELIILPGSKNVRGDLALLHQCGWHNDINRHLRYGGKVLGICGGYQHRGRDTARGGGHARAVHRRSVAGVVT